MRGPCGPSVTGVRALVAGTDGSLWISDGHQLQQWQAGELRTVTAWAPDEAPVRALRAGWWAGQPALWFLTADGTPSALAAGPDGLVRWRMADAPHGATALALDADGGAWVVADGLWRFDGAHWQPVALGGIIVDVAGHPRAPDVWLTVRDGTLWHSAGGRFRPVHSLPAARQTAVAADGALWLGSAEGVLHVAPGRSVRLEGPPDGSVLLEPATLTVQPARPADVETLTWALDGGAPEALAGPPWALRLDPAEIGPGEHAIDVRVTWLDGEQLSVAWGFAVPRPPSWREDIRPLFLAQCSTNCHGDRGQARPLYESAQWRAIIDQILDAVRQGRMPLANEPLSPAQIDLIDGWRVAGMPEE